MHVDSVYKSKTQIRLSRLRLYERKDIKMPFRRREFFTDEMFCLSKKKSHTYQKLPCYIFISRCFTTIKFDRMVDQHAVTVLYG